MSKGLINILLTICQKEAETYPLGKVFTPFADEYNLGFTQGKVRVLSEKDRQKIKTILANEMGVDPATLTSAWDNLPRHEALKLGYDEKLSRLKVRDERVAIKTLPGRPLLLGVSSIQLPDATNLDIAWQTVARDNRHDTVLVVENWKNFELTHLTPLLLKIAGNPLVLYRGDPIYQTDHCNELLKALRLPVLAFVDYDPAGLIIANSIPYFKEMVCPSRAELEGYLEDQRNHQRFSIQKGRTPAALESLSDPQLVEIAAVLDKYGVALPQEALIQAS